jgi:CRISPR-associated protein Cas5t
MLGVYVGVPVACFRKGQMREYLETEALPPPATCYGFLLALVGEESRRRHLGCRVAPVLLNVPCVSTVLRTVWRLKGNYLGAAGNTRPDYQQLLSPVELLLWLDSTEEEGDSPRLEDRVRLALEHPERITRYGGLCLGESTHLVDEVKLEKSPRSGTGRAFLLAPEGRFTLPVWVDHVGSTGTVSVTGNLEDIQLSPPPPVERLARITNRRSPHEFPIAPLQI